MMISPEAYYQIELKGKSIGELQREIRSLKMEINRIKTRMENPNYKPRFISPSDDTVLYWSREYLAMAKKALSEAGGEYSETEAERRAAAFLAKLPYLKRIVFEIGGCFRAWEKYTIEISDETIHASSTLAEDQNFLPLDGPICTSIWEPDRRISSREELLEYLRELYLEEWRHYYDPERFGITVMDGTQWELKLEFSGGHRAWTTGGSNDYPYNFQEFLWLFGLEHPNTYDNEDEDDN